MKLKKTPTISCIRLINTLVFAVLPLYVISQNNTSQLSSGGDVSLEMVVVPVGTFSMGCTFEQTEYCAYDEKPEHQVSLKGFAIAKYEVAQKLWKEIVTRPRPSTPSIALVSLSSNRSIWTISCATTTRPNFLC